MRAIRDESENNSLSCRLNGGGRGIRTPGTLSGTAVFKTACFNHSHIPPREQVLGCVHCTMVFCPARRLLVPEMDLPRIAEDDRGSEETPISPEFSQASPPLALLTDDENVVNKSCRHYQSYCIAGGNSRTV